MKTILMTMFAAMAIFASCSSNKNDTPETAKAKSLELTLGLENPKTKMSDGTVTNSVVAAVRANIQNITIEYFSATGSSIASYKFTPEEVQTVISDNQAGARVPVRLENIPNATSSVNVYMNVKTATSINDLQDTYNVMEYRGDAPASIVLSNSASGVDGNDVYSVEVTVKPILSRFEFTGDLTINKPGGTLPQGITNGTLAQAQAHVSDVTIKLAVEAAKDAWRLANPGVQEPSPWVLTYNVSYSYNAGYDVTSIDGYYMNNILLTRGGELALNSNDLTGDWSAAAKSRYNKTTPGDMSNMFDITAPAADKRIVYNLLPQTFTPAVAGAPTVAEVKSNLPHFILKLTTTATPATRWVTVRAFRSTATGTPLITSFESGKAYILDASQIEIGQYIATLTVTAGGTKGPDVTEDKDPTDPNPEPQGKDLEVLVRIADWQIVNIKPEW